MAELDIATPSCFFKSYNALIEEIQSVLLLVHVYSVMQLSSMKVTVGRFGQFHESSEIELTMALKC